MKIKLIYDLATPTAERRPTFYEDLVDDIQVRNYTSEYALLGCIKKLTGYEASQIRKFLNKRYNERLSLDECIEFMLDALSDPGDGSPNIIYLSVDGEVKYDLNILNDPENATKEDIINTYIENGWIEED